MFVLGMMQARRRILLMWYTLTLTAVLVILIQSSKENPSILLTTSVSTTKRSPHQLIRASPYVHNESYLALNSYTDYTINRLGLKFLDPETALDPDLGPVVNDVLSFTHPINVNSSKCSAWAEKTLNSSDSLLIVVYSAAQNYEEREAIRRTLVTLKDENPYRELIFLVGTGNRRKDSVRLKNESLIHGDVVQVDVVDTYTNLTLKSVALLHWVHTHCPNADYVLKSDDDNFINWNVLNKVIASFNKDSKSIYGFKVGTTIPGRMKFQKHYISHETWPWSRYPVYLMGGAYVITRSAVRPLLAAAQTTPYAPFEDLYISGLCAFKAKVAIYSSKRLYTPDYPFGVMLNRRFVCNIAVWQTITMKQYFRSENTTRKIYNSTDCT